MEPLNADTLGAALKCPDYQGVLRGLNFPKWLVWDLHVAIVWCHFRESTFRGSTVLQ